MGFVGYWLKTSTTGLTTRIGIDDSADSTERSNSVAVNADGSWHLYEWDLADAANWNAWVGTSNGAINGNGTIDAIWIEAATTNGNVVVSLDDVQHRVIPEPASALLILSSVMGVVATRRRS
jgi:hypothetical protein